MIEWRGLLDLLIAYLVALPVGWERERFERSAGLRTFPLVAVASAGFVIIAERALHDSNAVARVIQGLIGGIGFVAGGAILKYKLGVHGTATASSLLATGAMGIAVAYRQYDIAVALSGLSYITLRLFERWKEVRDRDVTGPENDRA
jgi:putative Mg2+ transporter-C (MgtC) family protein